MGHEGRLRARAQDLGPCAGAQRWWLVRFGNRVVCRESYLAVHIGHVFTKDETDTLIIQQYEELVTVVVNSATFAGVPVHIVPSIAKGCLHEGWNCAATGRGGGG